MADAAPTPLITDLGPGDPLRLDGPILRFDDNRPFFDGAVPRPRQIVFQSSQPNSLSCRVVDKGVSAAIGALLRIPEARELRRELTTRAVQACNELGDTAQVVVATTMVVGAATYVGINHREIVDKLGNSTFSIPMSLEGLDVPGTLQVRVQLDDWRPAGGGLEYSRQLGGGDFSAGASFGRDATSGAQSYGVFLRWSKSF